MSARRVLLALMLLSLLVNASFTLLAYLGQYWWPLDILSNFRAQYVASLVPVGLVLIALGQWRWAGVAQLSALLNLWAIVPLYLGRPTATDTGKPSLDLISFNVHMSNHRTAQVASYLAGRAPEVLVLLEATPEMQVALHEALPAHQMFGIARTDSFGILFFSRLETSEQRILYLANSELPAIEAKVQVDGTSFSILALHTMPPAGAANAALRDRILDEAAAWARAHEHAIILGDFNATPWSHAFRSLLQAGHLHNSQEGFGLQTSWPSGLWPVSIAIDHAVHSETLRTMRRSLGPFLGSDHRPLHVQIGLR